MGKVLHFRNGSTITLAEEDVMEDEGKTDTVEAVNAEILDITRLEDSDHFGVSVGMNIVIDRHYLSGALSDANCLNKIVEDLGKSIAPVIARSLINRLNNKGK